ncbi:MAG: hypothetical protein GX813_02865 [Erysipelotrichia bacterium]|nr:hypothetical protein [Erysipelotrichia bacterium]
MRALNYIKRSHYNKIDDNFLAALYAKLLGTEELTTYYRIFEDKNPENRVLIDRIYTSAPAGLIEPMMSNLFTFITSSSLSPTLKAMIVYFYINYVKPFDRYSEEVSILMAKAVLAHEAFGELVIDFPFEKLLLLPKEETARVYVEVQKTSDITYFVDYIYKHLNQLCDDLLDDFATNKVEALRHDFYQSDDDEGTDSPATSKVETVDLFATENTEVAAQNKDVAPIKEKPEAPKKKTIKVKYVQEELAVSYIPVALDEKQAILLEQDLLERDPLLKKGEAKFYARHCTKNRKYTIAQYKKYSRCAYETARTSMDHLAELLYYRKEKVKNKYVYIPIERD